MEATGIAWIIPNASCARELPTGALCVLGQWNAKGRHNSKQRCRSPWKACPPPAPKFLAKIDKVLLPLCNRHASDRPPPGYILIAQYRRAEVDPVFAGCPGL